MRIPSAAFNLNIFMRLSTLTAVVFLFSFKRVTSHEWKSVQFILQFMLALGYNSTQILAIGIYFKVLIELSIYFYLISQELFIFLNFHTINC